MNQTWRIPNQRRTSLAGFTLRAVRPCDVCFSRYFSVGTLGCKLVVDSFVHWHGTQAVLRLKFMNVTVKLISVRIEALPYNLGLINPAVKQQERTQAGNTP